MRPVWAIVRRELKALFDLPTAYILLVVFVAVNDFLYFRQAEPYGVASLRPMFDLLPWLLLFIVPAVTMRALAEDRHNGTLEVVLAQPITEFELLIGKYVSQVLFLWIALALTLVIPLGLLPAAHLELGVIFAQYVGAAMLVAGFAGVGVWASSVTRNQVTAFILGVSVMFLLVLVGLDPLLVGLPARLGDIAAALGVLAHFRQIARGVIDLRDAIYFVALAAIFLSLGYYALMRRRLSPQREDVRRLRLGTVLLVVALVVLNLFGRRIGGRLDLTPGRQFTLSPATRQILRSLPDFVTVKLFASDALPSEVAFIKRDVDDMLRDYRAAGNGKLRLVTLDPTDDSLAAREAQTLGIPPVQFNVLGQSSLQVKQGYLGLAIQYAGETRPIPLVRQTNDLEYHLTSLIRDLTRPDRPTIVWLDGTSTNQSAGAGYQALRQDLTRNYTIQELPPGDAALPAQARVLVLAGTPDSLPAGLQAVLAGYLDHGGAALVMADGMSRSLQSPYAMARPVAWNALLTRYGVTIRSDMVYDLASNEPVSMRSQLGQLVVSYPFWIRALSTRAAPINAEVPGVFLPWASSIDTTGARPGTVTPLFVTSRSAGVSQREVMLTPQQEFPQTDLRPRVLAVLVNPRGAADSATADSGRGRLVVIGSSDFASDRYVQNEPANAIFVENAVDWLAQDNALLTIRSKNRTPPPLVYSSAFMQVMVRYVNLIGVPLLVVAFGALRLVRRRRRQRTPYRPLTTGAAS